MLRSVAQSCPTLCDLMDCSPARLLCSWGFSRQEYWSGLPFPAPGDLPNPGIASRSPALWADSLPSEPPGEPNISPYVSVPQFVSPLSVNGHLGYFHLLGVVNNTAMNIQG